MAISIQRDATSSVLQGALSTIDSSSMLAREELLMQMQSWCARTASCLQPVATANALCRKAYRKSGMLPHAQLLLQLWTKNGGCQTHMKTTPRDATSSKQQAPIRTASSSTLTIQ